MNRERFKDLWRAWANRNPQRMRAIRQRYLDKNPEKRRAWRAARRARVLAAGGSFSASELQAQYRAQDGRCFYCQEPLDERYHADHKTPLARGGAGDISTIVCACEHCNKVKATRTAEEFLRLRALAPDTPPA